MKKIIALLTALVLVFAFTACGKSDSGKEVVFGEMKITLPADFTDRNDLIPEESEISYLYANGAMNVAFVALTEQKSDFEGTKVKSLDDYLQTQHDNSKGGENTSEIIEDNGLKYFVYVTTPETTPFKYFSTAYETDDAYWFVQFYTTEELYPSYQQNFLKWAHTVTKA